MPALFEKLGVRFRYPENWRLEEIGTDEEPTGVSLTSPGGAFWSLSAHPPEDSPQDLAAQALQAMREQYGEVDAEPITELWNGHRLTGYEMNFYCLDLTNTAWVRGFQTPLATYVLFCQGEDRELVQVEPVFRALLASLMAESPWQEH